MFNIFSIIPFPVSSPVFPPITRKTDALGSGHFGASRDGGARLHLGLDLKTYPGQLVYAPISGILTPFMYNGMHAFKIEGKFFTVTVLYLMLPPRKTGHVFRGEWVAKAANIKPTYGQGITNHVHFAVKNKDGENINPKTVTFTI